MFLTVDRVPQCDGHEPEIIWSDVESRLKLSLIYYFHATITEIAYGSMEIAIAVT
jgi:hypothetical protein